jgi:acetyl esterase/lipase
MVVVALDFRQAKEGRYPIAMRDVVAGIRWARANAERLDLSPDSIGLIGGSSGGHLAVLAALRPNAPEYASPGAAGESERTSIEIAYALPLWPILDPIARYRYALGRRDEPPEARRDRFFQPERLIAAHELFYGDEATMSLASAQRMVEAGEFERLPPLWIAHPELDENVTLAMTERFVAAYRRAGGPIELEVFPAVGHSFANFPGEAADRCIARMRAFIAKQLGVGSRAAARAT